MKQVYRIDSNKFYIEDVVLDDGEIIPSDCREDKPKDGFTKPKRNASDTGWIDGATQLELELVGLSLNSLKKNKLNELNQSCESTILGRFKAVLDGVEYEFSNDDKAQSRFNGSPYLFTSGITDSIEWTCYLDGKRTSVILDETKFNIVANAAFEHQNTNIAKFRQKIADLEVAQNIPEIEKIIW